MERWIQLFKKLGYEIEKNSIDKIVLYKDDDNVIHFDKEDRTFWKSGKWDGMHEPINVDELVAINNLFRAYGFFDKYQSKKNTNDE